MSDSELGIRVPVDGGTIFAVEHGSGSETVLLIHGWPQTHREWTGVADQLASCSRVIMPDLRGCGESVKSSNEIEASTLAADMFAVLEHAKADRAHVVAHDIGGASAYALACIHPQKVASLTLFETPIWGVTSGDVPHLPDLFWHLKFHGEVDLAAALIGAEIELYLDHFFSDFANDPRAISHAERGEYLRSYAKAGGLRASLMHYEAIERLGEQFSTFSRKKLSVPVQAYGSASVMGEYVVKAARLIADNVTGGVIQDCGHWMPEEKTDEVARIIKRSVAATASGQTV